MKKIPLSKGKFALVDDEDFKELNKFRWFADNGGRTFYAKRMGRYPNGNRKVVSMHRQILMLTDPIVHVDHYNNNGLDNRKQNLRTCSHSENLRNQQKSKNNTSGFKGVSWYKRDSKWRAQININGKTKFLGVFNDPQEAARAYDDASLIHFKSYAKPNF